MNKCPFCIKSLRSYYGELICLECPYYFRFYTYEHLYSYTIKDGNCYYYINNYPDITGIFMFNNLNEKSKKYMTGKLNIIKDIEQLKKVLLLM